MNGFVQAAREGRIIILGHQGVYGEAPANSLSGFRKAVEMGLELPQFSGMKLSDKIDFRHLFELVSHGAIGNLVEMESAEGETLRMYVG